LAWTLYSEHRPTAERDAWRPDSIAWLNVDPQGVSSKQLNIQTDSPHEEVHICCACACHVSR
jgi:hypothetical protein